MIALKPIWVKFGNGLVNINQYDKLYMHTQPILKKVDRGAKWSFLSSNIDSNYVPIGVEYWVVLEYYYSKLIEKYGTEKEQVKRYKQLLREISEKTK